MPSLSDIMAARKAISGYVYETPIIASKAMSLKTGHEEVLFKCENLQRTGSYHLRGHMYKVIRTIEQDMGVNHFVTYSTANGGPALSCAANSFQSEAHVVVPEDTVEPITRSIRHYGGQHYYCKPMLEDRERVVEGLMQRYNRVEGKQRHQAVLVHPYDDEHIITGHGTVGVEMMLQTDCAIDCVVAPVGGGSLISGVAIAVKGMKPHVGVFAAEPAVLDDTFQSFKRGELVVERRREGHTSDTNPYCTKTVAKGLQHPLTERTFGYMKRHVDGILRVSEDEIRYAMRYVFERCKLVIDTNAATAVAAVLSCPPELKKYRRVAVILSGGNIDLNQLASYMAAKL